MTPPLNGVLDFRYFLNRKTRLVGNSGQLLHLRAICFSALHLTDGHISHEGAVDLAGEVLDSDSGALVPPSRSDAERLVANVVSAGLFDRNGHGYVIHDWTSFYPLRETVEKRERWKRKKRRRSPTEGDVPPSEGTFPPTDQISGSSSVCENSQVSSVQSRADADEDQDPDFGESRTPAWFAGRLRDADPRTAPAIASVVRQYGLPEAALHAALEVVQERKPRNEAGYFVSVLKDLGQNRRYA